MAKATAKQFGGKTSEYIKNYEIDKYTLEGQTGLIEIAKIATQLNEEITSKFIQNYEINKFSIAGQRGLIDIAKLAVQKDVSGTSKYIQNYQIDNYTPEGQQGLIEIAKLGAQISGKWISYFIGYYDIDNSTSEGQRGLIEIAKLAAQQNGADMSLYILNYRINDATSEGQRGLIDIAKLAAPQDAQILQNIKNYNINFSSSEGQQGLMEILEWVGQKKITDALEYLKTCDITSYTPENKVRIDNLCDKFVYECILNQDSFTWRNLKGVYNLLSSLSMTDLTGCIDLCNSAFEKITQNNLSGAVNDFYEILNKKFQISTQEMQWIVEEYQKYRESHIQKAFLEWYFIVALLFILRKESRECFLNQQKLFQAISKQHTPIREALVKELIRIYAYKQQDRWINLQKISKGKKHIELPALMLFREEDSVIGKTLEILKKGSLFKDGKLLILFLDTLVKIRRCSFTDVEKTSVLQSLSNNSNPEILLKRLRWANDLLSFKEEAQLTKCQDADKWQDACHEIFVNKLGVKINDFDESYSKTLGSWRAKFALITYASRLKNVNLAQKAQELFQDFLKQVLSQTFQQKRYEINQNKQLAAIQQNHPEVLKKWQNSIKLTLSELSLKEGLQEDPIEDTILKTLKQALEQNHLGPDQPIIYPSLALLDVTDIDKLLEIYTQIRTQLQPFLGRTLKNLQAKKEALLIQKFILELFLAPENLEKGLSNLKSRLPKKVEFYTDVNHSLTLLRKSNTQTTTLSQVIDSDDPNHFLLMGTEVLNSCMNVNSYEGYNRCILSYAMDGKHRLGLVCNSEGQILARSVFRLLIDYNGKPVLFQEKVYVADSALNYRQLLRKLAVKKAADMGIPLVFKEYSSAESTVSYPGTLHAQDLLIPFEYVDANSTTETSSYVIGNVFQLKQS